LALLLVDFISVKKRDTPFFGTAKVETFLNPPTIYENIFQKIYKRYFVCIQNKE
jgi:hypothetical protein